MPRVLFALVMLLWAGVMMLCACSAPASPLPTQPVYVLAGESINGGQNRLTVLDGTAWTTYHDESLPRSLAFNLDKDPQGRLWIGFVGYVGFPDNRLHIYTSEGTLIKEMRPCDQPTGTAFAGGRAFVACQDRGFRGYLVVIDLQTLDVVQTIELAIPDSIFLVGAVAANGEYVAVAGATEVDSKGYTAIILINPQNLEIVAQLANIEALGTHVRRIIPYEGRFYLLNGGNWEGRHMHESDIFVLEPGTSPTVTTLTTARAPLWGDIADGMLYAYHEQKRHLADFEAPCLISRLDLTSGVVETWGLPNGWRAGDLRVIGRDVLLTRMGKLGDDPNDGIYRFDPSTGTVTLLVDVPDATKLAAE